MALSQLFVSFVVGLASCWAYHALVMKGRY